MDAEVLTLKRLCRSLDGLRKKSHQEAVEWQNFGRFTAAVLQKEVDSFERKLRVLQERLDGLVKENSKLREMCFYLDSSREKSAADGRRGEGGLKSATRHSKDSQRTPVHSMCAEEMNKDVESAFQYSGITSEDTLRDRKVKKFNILGTKGKLSIYLHIMYHKSTSPQIAAIQIHKQL